MRSGGARSQSKSARASAAPRRRRGAREGTGGGATSSTACDANWHSGQPSSQWPGGAPARSRTRRRRPGCRERRCLRTSPSASRRRSTGPAAHRCDDRAARRVARTRRTRRATPQHAEKRAFRRHASTLPPSRPTRDHPLAIASLALATVRSESHSSVKCERPGFCAQRNRNVRRRAGAQTHDA